ncbi:MAG: hypothetical protein ACOCXJ_06050, partial [Planctomycetota bacterium]
MPRICRPIVLALALTGLLGAAEQAAPQPLPVTIADEVVGHIDPRLFGQFMEISGHEPGPEAAIDPDTGALHPAVRRAI